MEISMCIKEKYYPLFLSSLNLRRNEISERVLKEKFELVAGFGYMKKVTVQLEGKNEILSEFKKSLDKNLTGFKDHKVHSYVHREYFLGCVLEKTKSDGFVSSKEESENNPSTAEQVYETIYKNSNQIELSEEVVQDIKQAILWITSYGGKNTFLKNLKRLCKKEYIKVKDIKLLASLVPTYLRNKEQLQANEYYGSKHIGKIKERLTLKVKLNDFNSYNTKYGEFNVYTFTDTNENVIILKGNKKYDFVEGETYRVKATVKDHEIRNGIRKTVVNRIKKIK